jgi:hypothetical protein
LNEQLRRNEMNLDNQRIKNIAYNTTCKVTSKAAPHVFGMGSGKTAKEAYQKAYTDYRQGAWGK